MSARPLADFSFSLLVIDDTSSLTEKIKTFLDGNSSVRVEQHIANRMNSITAVTANNPDFVIINFEMKGTDVLELTHTIESQTQSKILVVCDTVEENKIRDIMSSGVNGIILSSSVQNDLLFALQSIQNGDHFFSPSIAKSIVAFYLKQTIDERKDTSSSSQ